MFCFIHRHRIASAIDTDGALQASTAGHLTRCAACRAHHAAQSRIAHALRTPAGHARDESLPPFLLARIRLRVATERVAASTPEPWRRLAWPAVLAGAALLALVAGLLVQTPPGSQESPAPVAQAAPETPPAIPAGAGHADTPAQVAVRTGLLEDELAHVAADTHALLAFLAESFVPGTGSDTPDRG